MIDVLRLMDDCLASLGWRQYIGRHLEHRFSLRMSESIGKEDSAVEHLKPGGCEAGPDKGC